MGSQQKAAARVRHLTEALVAVPSVVNTSGELDLAMRIRDQILSIPYFAERAETHVRMVRTQNDPLERFAVLALVEGRRTTAVDREVPTVVLTGHYDTVDVQDYGEYRSLAFAPAGLAAVMSDLSADGETLADMATGDWLPGRGALDMKSGIAVNLWVLEQFCANLDQYAGNVLFVATPDEEDMSRGMEVALPAMKELAGERHLRYVAALNNDYTAPRFPGDPHRYVYLGSIGKLLPAFYVFGKETHVGQVFEGLDPNLLVAEITRRLSYNMEFAECTDGECTPPPVALKQADFKGSYTVQTALGAHCYFNFFTFYRSPAEVLALCKREAEAAFATVVERVQHHYDWFCRNSGLPQGTLPWRVRVVTFEEWYHQLLERRGEPFRSHMEAFAARLAAQPNLDLRAYGARMVEEMWRWSDQKQPIVVVYFCSSYWQSVSLQPANPKDQAVREVVEELVAASAQGYNIQTRRFYPYISEMSMIGRPLTNSIETLAANTPGWGLKYTFDIDTPRWLDMPAVNLGPFGKDAHKCTERVHMHYSFEVLPAMTLDLVARLLGA